MSNFTNGELLKILHEHIPYIRFNGEINRLSGGNINVVWRAKGEKNVIIKYAPPHIATNPDVALSDSRIDFEARVLKEFSKEGRLFDISSDETRPPKLLAYVEEHSLIIMEDVGDFRELDKVNLCNHNSEKIGERLGRFIGNFHRSTLHNEAFGSEFHNFEIQNVRNLLQYQPAHNYVNVQDSALVDKLKNKCTDLGNRLTSPGKCLIMGDLWPASVLVNQAWEIRIIDWEFVHFGRPLQDVGHCAAHCRMQQHIAQYRNGAEQWNNFWQTFWEGYKAGTGTAFEQLIDNNELTDIGVHIGSEILMRTFGPFKDGYVYESFDDTHKVMNEAREMAIEYILYPKKSAEDFGF